MTWISGVPLDRSDLRLSRSALSDRASRTASFAAATCGRVLAGDDDVEAVRGEAGGLRDRDVVAVGLHRRERLRQGHRVARQVDVVVEPTNSDPGAVRGPAALGGDDRLEARVALARDGRLDEHDVRRPAEEDLLGLDRPLEHGLGARARRAARWSPGPIFSPPALMNVVGQQGDQRGRSPRTGRAAATTTPSFVQRLRSAALIAGRVGLDPEGVGLGSPSSSTLILTLSMSR